MKKENIDRLILSFLSGYAPSRASVAKECSVSDTTASKVAKALINSGFMVERTFAKKGEATCAHFFCRDCACILLIDISTSVYKMSIVSSTGKVRFRTYYEYDMSISPFDNLAVFLERHSDKAKKSGYAFCAISVIYADDNAIEHLENRNIRSHLTSVISKELISQAVYEVFGKRPLSHFTVSKAISEAIKFKVHDNSIGLNGMSYIFIGSHISLFHAYESGEVAVCSPQGFLTDEEKKLLIIGKYMQEKDAERLFIKLAGYMGAAFAPSFLILESDACTPDRITCEKITRAFSVSSMKVPIIYTKDNSFPLHELGAVRSTLHTVISRYIT